MRKIAHIQPMPMAAEQIEKLIRTSLPDAQIKLVDTAGDSDHFSVEVTSALFAGKSRVEQHRMVYAALNGGMGTTLHALAVTTKVAQGQ